MTTIPTGTQPEKPTEADLRVAQIRLYERQARWEVPKAVAMLVLGSSAIIATSRLLDWVVPHPSQPQVIILRTENVR